MNFFDERCSYCNCRLPTHFALCVKGIRTQPIRYIQPYGYYLNPRMDAVIKAHAEYPITDPPKDK